jgi:hypothetical protein
MHSPTLRALFAAAALAAGAGGVLFACSNGESGFGDAAGDGGGSGGEGGSGADGGMASDDAGSSSNVDGSFDICGKTAEYELGCGRGGNLTCGDAGFAAWCAQNDKIINSAQYDQAELLCLSQANCDQVKRHDCDYQAYGKDKLDTAQSAMVAAYCQTCEPKDLAGCATRQTTYDPKAGPNSVSDVFVAAWELSDTLVDQVRQKCTGVALDAGVDASADGGVAACAKAFSNCSGGVYVDALPNCPK